MSRLVVEVTACARAVSVVGRTYESTTTSRVLILMRGILAFSSVLALSARAERSLDAGACAGARSVRFRFVHVPKSGGMTLTCSFDLGYRAGLPPCRALERTRVPTELEGRHRTASLRSRATTRRRRRSRTRARACR